jgi:hypothetical protein
MRPLILLVPFVALSACAPDPVGFDKHPIGATTAAIDARASAQATQATRASAPVYSVSSQQMRSSGTPLPQSEAAMRAIAERKTENGLPIGVGGQSFKVSQVAYDGQDFLVARNVNASSILDHSEALKSMASLVTPCSASGPAYRADVGYAIALTCL